MQQHRLFIRPAVLLLLLPWPADAASTHITPLTTQPNLQQLQPHLNTGTYRRMSIDKVAVCQLTGVSVHTNRWLQTWLVS